MTKICIVGGGAAGLMCAGFASTADTDVTLYEKNKSERKIASENFYDNAYLGKKLLITGKGRCNVTNNCTADEFLSHITANAKFMYAAFNCFSSQNTMDFFESMGVPLKTERGNRVFPQSDKSVDVLKGLKKCIREKNVKVRNKKVVSIVKKNGGFEVFCSDNTSDFFDKVIICTGGVSYPQTGSDGDGYRFAEDFGHTVKEPVPSLVPLECGNYQICSDMSGLSLKNVKLTVTDKTKNKPVFSELGEMLFTHFGISGPLVLSASAHMKKFAPDKYRADIDLKPALDVQTIDSKLVKLFEKEKNKNLSNVLGDMLPKSMCEPFCGYCGISYDAKPNSITKAERRTIAEAFKRFSLDISAFRPISEAIVTSGGVNVKEINPSTMESKLVSGLYFAGEVIDVDAYTGGFNLQIAFSTAHLAAKNAAEN